MKYFLDTEFIEGEQNSFTGKTKPTIDLISIGIVAEDGREYYAISKNFNLKEAWKRYEYKEEVQEGKAIGIKTYWLRENILKPIWEELVSEYMKTHMIPDDHWYFNYGSLKSLINLYGINNKQIAEEVLYFCNEKTDGKHEIEMLGGEKTSIEFYGYYADYDWVVFCWLFGTMMELPESFPMYCRDLQQMSDELWKNRIFSNYQKPEDHPEYPKQENEHNALADAYWNFKFYKFLTNGDR